MCYIPVTNPRVLSCSSARSSRISRKRSSPWTSVLFNANRKLRHKNPTVPRVAEEVIRHGSDGWYGRSSSAISMAACYLENISVSGKSEQRSVVMKEKGVWHRGRQVAGRCKVGCLGFCCQEISCRSRVSGLPHSSSVTKTCRTQHDVVLKACIALLLPLPCKR